MVESLAEDLSESHTDNSCDIAVSSRVCTIQYTTVVRYVEC